MSGGTIGALIGLAIAAITGVVFWVRRLLDDAATRGHRAATEEAAIKWVAREREIAEANARAERERVSRQQRHAADLARLETDPKPADVAELIAGAGVTDEDVAKLTGRKP